MSSTPRDLFRCKDHLDNSKKVRTQNLIALCAMIFKRYLIMIANKWMKIKERNWKTPETITKLQNRNLQLEPNGISFRIANYKIVRIKSLMGTSSHFRTKVNNRWVHLQDLSIERRPQTLKRESWMLRKSKLLSRLPVLVKNRIIVNIK